VRLSYYSPNKKSRANAISISSRKKTEASVMKKVFGTVVCVVFYLASVAQSKYTVSGIVKDDKTGEELIGASVYLKDTTGIGTVTNSYGFFSLSIPISKSIFNSRKKFWRSSYLSVETPIVLNNRTI
jgi:hypothetical protein